MSRLFRINGPFFIVLALLTSLLVPTKSQALTQFQVAPSTVWGYTFAGKF